MDNNQRVAKYRKYSSLNVLQTLNAIFEQNE